MGRRGQGLGMSGALGVALVTVTLGCPGPQYPRCEGDHQCHAPEVCVFSQCHRCALDSHCPADQECLKYACQPRQECLTGDQCSNGWVCKEHRCAPECTVDKDCAASKACKQNHCVAMEPACSTAGDCAAGQACREGACVTPVAGDPDFVTTYGTPATAVVEPENTKPLSGVDFPGGRLLCGALVRVYFGFNESALTDESRASLAKTAQCLKEQAQQEVTILGHTDERGSTEYNLALGERRALAVRLYLRDLGVPVKRMNVVSVGEERPLDLGHDEAAWAHNRRGEVIPRP